MVDAVELDPVGVREPLLAEARPPRDGHGRTWSAVPQTIRTGQAIDSPRRARSPRAARARSSAARRRSRPRPRMHVRDQLGGDVLVVRRERSASPGGGPRGVETTLVGIRRGGLHLLLAWSRSRAASPCTSRRPAAQPPAGASATTDSARRARRAAARGSRPSELPTMCAVAKPASSIARSSASGSVAARDLGRRAAARRRGPASVGASTSCSALELRAGRAPRCARCR